MRPRAVSPLGNRPRGAAEKLATGASAGGDLVTQIIDIVRVCAECSREIAQHRAERARVEAHAWVQVEYLRSRKEVMVSFLERTFGEREQNFHALFERLDVALAAKNIEGTKAVLDAIVTLARSSPFEALRHAASAHEVLLDKNTSWEF